MPSLKANEAARAKSVLALAEEDQSKHSELRNLTELPPTTLTLVFTKTVNTNYKCTNGLSLPGMMLTKSASQLLTDVSQK